MAFDTQNDEASASPAYSSSTPRGMQRASTAPHSSSRGRASPGSSGASGGAAGTAGGAGGGTSTSTDVLLGKATSRSDRLRDTTHKVPSYIPHWARGEVDGHQRQLELMSGGRKASRTQPYLPLGCPILEMPHPIDLLHGKQVHDGSGAASTMARQQQNQQQQHDAGQNARSTLLRGSSAGATSRLTLMSEQRAPRSRDSFGPWQTLKRRTRESSTNVRACKYGANFLEQLGSRAHRLTQRTSKTLREQVVTQQHLRRTQAQEHAPEQQQHHHHQFLPNSSNEISDTPVRSRRMRPRTAPADFYDALSTSGFFQGSPGSYDSRFAVSSSSRPRVLTSYTKGGGSGITGAGLKEHLLPYEHAMTFEALFAQSENALRGINSRLEAKLTKMEETRYKNYQRKYSAVTELGSVRQNSSHINFRKHLRAVRCKMALEATREALDMISSHPWYGELNRKLEETHRLCGHVSVGESFLVEEVGKVLAEGKHFTKENFRSTLMRLPLEAHQLLEVQDIIYFIGNKVSMSREEYRHWMSVFGRAQADDIIRAYDRIRRQFEGDGVRGSNNENASVTQDVQDDDIAAAVGSGKVTKVAMKKISAAKFLQLRSIAFAGEQSDNEDSVQEESMSSDVQHGAFRFLKSHSCKMEGSTPSWQARAGIDLAHGGEFTH